MKVRVEIRPVRLDDLREIFTLGRKAFGNEWTPCHPAWNETNLAEILAHDPEISLVAVMKKSVAGFLIASLDETGGTRSAMIWWLCADPSKYDGLTGELLGEFRTILSERGIEKIMVALSESNTELIDYYRNFGFTDSKRLIIMENFSPKKPR